MGIAVNILAQEFGYGNPQSIGEPLGLWSAAAPITGDATGGDIQVRFNAAGGIAPDRRLEYVYFVHGCEIQSPAQPGNLSVRLVAHWKRPNVNSGPPFVNLRVVDSLFDGLAFLPSFPLVPDHWRQMPIFWDTQELASGIDTIVQLHAELNVDAQSYTFNAWGLYFDRQILQNRAFGRLVLPAGFP